MTLFELCKSGSPKRVYLVLAKDLQAARRLLYAVRKFPNTVRLRARRTITVGTDSRPAMLIGVYLLDRNCDAVRSSPAATRARLHDDPK